MKKHRVLIVVLLLALLALLDGVALWFWLRCCVLPWSQNKPPSQSCRLAKAESRRWWSLARSLR